MNRLGLFEQDIARKETLSPEYSSHHLELLDRGGQDRVTMSHVYVTIFTTVGFR
jgi:hypothetical protein